MNDARRQRLASLLLNSSLCCQLVFVSIGMAAAGRRMLIYHEPLDPFFLTIQVAVYLNWVGWSWAARNPQILVANGVGCLSASALLVCSWWIS